MDDSDREFAMVAIYMGHLVRDYLVKPRAKHESNPSSLSETGGRCEKSAERGQILRDLQRQYRDIDQKAREIWPVQVILQPTILVSDRLLGTDVYISRYPLFAGSLSSFARIVDLTAEFPRWYEVDPQCQQYQCFANLDGIALANLSPFAKLKSGEKVLIHCAQGHGRSATFAALWLAKNAIFSTPQEAYLAIVKARPAAKLASSQGLQLQEISEVRT